MGRRRRLVLALTLASLAACGPRKSRPAASAGAERPPELSMHGLTVQSWSAKGLEWELRAPVGEGFTQRNIIQVSSMNVQLFDEGERSSEITAARAIMATGDRPNPPEVPRPIEPVPGIRLVPGDMYLDGGVVVVSTEGSRVATPWVQYHVDEQLIRSTAPVEVTRNDSITRGQGLEATSDLSSLRIFHQTLTIKGDEGAE